MKNKLSDLNNHLFAELERLSDESLTEEQLEIELKRTVAINKLATNLTSSAALTLKAAEFAYGTGGKGAQKKLTGLFSEETKDEG